MNPKRYHNKTLCYRLQKLFHTQITTETEIRNATQKGGRKWKKNSKAENKVYAERYLKLGKKALLMLWVRLSTCTSSLTLPLKIRGNPD